MKIYEFIRCLIHFRTFSFILAHVAWFLMFRTKKRVPRLIKKIFGPMGPLGRLGPWGPILFFINLGTVFFFFETSKIKQHGLEWMNMYKNAKHTPQVYVLLRTCKILHAWELQKLTWQIGPKTICNCPGFIIVWYYPLYYDSHGFYDECKCLHNIRGLGVGWGG